VSEQPPAHALVQGEGPPLLLLHGWGASSELFAPVLSPLLQARTVVVPDLPGFGKTPAPPGPWSAHDYARWVVALLDRLELERCDVIGHSNGGRIAIVLAAEHPERVGKVVLVDSAGIRQRQRLHHRLRVRTYKMLRAAEGSSLLPQSIRRRARARADSRGSPDYRAASGVMRGTLVRLVNEDLAPLLPRIAAPVLLIWGDRDDDTPLEDARVMERLIPDAGLVVLKGAGHFSYLEQTHAFSRIVDVFLRGSAP
jgi:pimeloyl-ACP methyl ester carboxylesterase